MKQPMKKAPLCPKMYQGWGVSWRGGLSLRGGGGSWRGGVGGLSWSGGVCHGGVGGVCHGGGVCHRGVGGPWRGWGVSWRGGVGHIQSNLVIEANHHYLHTIPPGNYSKLLGEPNSITTT